MTDPGEYKAFLPASSSPDAASTPAGKGSRADPLVITSVSPEDHHAGPAFAQTPARYNLRPEAFPKRDPLSQPLGMTWAEFEERQDNATAFTQNENVEKKKGSSLAENKERHSFGMGEEDLVDDGQASKKVRKSADPKLKSSRQLDFEASQEEDQVAMFIAYGHITVGISSYDANIPVYARLSTTDALLFNIDKKAAKASDIDFGNKKAAVPREINFDESWSAENGREESIRAAIKAKLKQLHQEYPKSPKKDSVAKGADWRARAEEEDNTIIATSLASHRSYHDDDPTNPNDPPSRELSGNAIRSASATDGAKNVMANMRDCSKDHEKVIQDLEDVATKNRATIQKQAATIKGLKNQLEDSKNREEEAERNLRNAETDAEEKDKRIETMRVDNRYLRQESRKNALKVAAQKSHQPNNVPQVNATAHSSPSKANNKDTRQLLEPGQKFEQMYYQLGSNDANAGKFRERDPTIVRLKDNKRYLKTRVIQEASLVVRGKYINEDEIINGKIFGKFEQSDRQIHLVQKNEDDCIMLCGDKEFLSWIELVPMKDAIDASQTVF